MHLTETTENIFFISKFLTKISIVYLLLNIVACCVVLKFDITNNVTTTIQIVVNVFFTILLYICSVISSILECNKISDNILPDSNDNIFKKLINLFKFTTIKNKLIIILEKISNNLELRKEFFTSTYSYIGLSFILNIITILLFVYNIMVFIIVSNYNATNSFSFLLDNNIFLELKKTTDTERTYAILILLYNVINPLITIILTIISIKCEDIDNFYKKISV